MVDRQEASELLEKTLEELRAQTYGELLRYQEPATLETVGKSGTTYQLEIQAHWDDKKEKTLRVLVSIDDGGWRALHPLTGDFILSPDGTFVGE